MKKSIIVVICLLVAVMLVLSSCTSTGSAPKKPNPGKGHKRCGNEVIDKKEMCDDGAANTNIPNTNCYGGAFSYCDKDCETQAASCDFYCGDSVINGGESCDGDASIAGRTCTEMGLPGTANLRCNPDCTFDVSMCI